MTENMDCRERSRRRVQQLRDLINAIGVRRQEFDVESAVGVLFEQAADEVQIVEDGGVDDDQFATATAATSETLVESAAAGCSESMTVS